MKTEIKLNKRVARKVLEIVDQGLTSGKGNPIPGQMCVEAAVCFALGLPHSDDPPCVGKAVRAYKIRLNDSGWSSNEARTTGMRKLAIAQLGSNEIDQKEFSRYLALETIKRIVPEYLVKLNKSEELDKIIEGCKTSKDLETGREFCIRARKYAYAADAAAYAAADAADAAYAAYAADAADAAYAAYAAADAADAAAYAVAKKFTSQERDRLLTMSADIALEALIKLKSPGCKWLDIVDEKNLSGGEESKIKS